MTTTIPDLYADIGLRGADRSRPLIAEIVEVLLFSEARADASLLPPGTDPRGWWGDTGEAQGLGSTIWAYQGQPLTDDTLRAVEQAAERALASLLADGLAKAVRASATRTMRRLDLAVEVTKPDNSVALLRYPGIWG
jgi:phage gp46-like protein